MPRLGTPEHVRSIRQLYKGILRLQRGLPSEMQAAGTPFIRDEFRRHAGADVQKVVDDFVREWQEYVRLLSRQLSLRGIAKGQIGRHLDPAEIEKLSDQLAGQLFELKQEAEKPKI